VDRQTLKLTTVVKNQGKTAAHISLPASWVNEEVVIEIAGEPDLIKIVRTNNTTAHVYVPSRLIGKEATVTLKSFYDKAREEQYGIKPNQIR